MERAIKLSRRAASQRSVQVIVVVGLYLLFAPYLDRGIHQGLYTVSLLIKDLLLWLLPLTVSVFIAQAIISFEKRAPLFILSLFLFEAISNSMGVWYAFGCGHLATSHEGTFYLQPISDAFEPLWRMPRIKPVWWSADKGVFAGIIVGLLVIFFCPRFRTAISWGKEWGQRLLTRVFARLIPLFIVGFVARMHQTHLLQQVAGQYGDFLCWLVLLVAVYVAFLFLVGSGFSVAKAYQNMRNLLPATGIAFSSGCSLSTMPWTIAGAEKNLRNPDLAKAVIPATTNIQQIGDCIANAFLCFLIYTHFNGHAPSVGVWVLFSAVFVLARFATAAVLGGAIFVMLPIYEAYLGFTPEMIAIILAFNVILDPFITASNVICNGALCRLFETVWIRILERFSVVVRLVP